MKARPLELDFSEPSLDVPDFSRLPAVVRARAQRLRESVPALLDSIQNEKSFLKVIRRWKRELEDQPSALAARFLLEQLREALADARAEGTASVLKIRPLEESLAKFLVLGLDGMPTVPGVPTARVAAAAANNLLNHLAIKAPKTIPLTDEVQAERGFFVLDGETLAMDPATLGTIAKVGNEDGIPQIRRLYKMTPAEYFEIVYGKRDPSPSELEEVLGIPANLTSSITKDRATAIALRGEDSPVAVGPLRVVYEIGTRNGQALISYEAPRQLGQQGAQENDSLLLTRLIADRYSGAHEVEALPDGEALSSNQARLDRVLSAAYARYRPKPSDLKTRVAGSGFRETAEGREILAQGPNGLFFNFADNNRDAVMPDVPENLAVDKYEMTQRRAVASGLRCFDCHGSGQNRSSASGDEAFSLRLHEVFRGKVNPYVKRPEEFEEATEPLYETIRHAREQGGMVLRDAVGDPVDLWTLFSGQVPEDQGVLR